MGLIIRCCLSQAKRLECVGRQTSGYIELIGDLKIRHCITSGRSENAINSAIVIAKVQQARLDGLDRGTVGRSNAVISPVVIVWVSVRVVIVRIVVVRIIGKIIPRIPSTQAAPEAIDKNEEATMVEVGASAIPVAMPVPILSSHDMIANAADTLTRLPCDCRTRTLPARIIELRHYMRWMAKRGKARSCALKVPSATYGTHATEADATSASANTTCDLSDTMEAATAQVTADATAKSTTTTVSGSPCYRTDRQGCDANYQSNYLFHFHISTLGRTPSCSDCASVGYYGASKESLLAPPLR